MRLILGVTGREPDASLRAGDVAREIGVRGKERPCAIVRPPGLARERPPGLSAAGILKFVGAGASTGDALISPGVEKLSDPMLPELGRIAGRRILMVLHRIKTFARPGHRN